jgi:hypothetical protein
VKQFSDYIGRIDPSSRSACRIDCASCDQIVSDEAPAFVYFDVSVGQLGILCEDCHRKPE